MTDRLQSEPKLQSEPMGGWLQELQRTWPHSDILRYNTWKYTYSLLMERSSGTWLQEYSTMPRVLEILSNILHSIEYSYGSTEVPTGYPTFSIAYLIYSTSHFFVPSERRMPR